MSSTFGTLFSVTTFGESHCMAVGAVIDGCPSGLSLSEEDIQVPLNRRRPGQSDISTPRSEKDTVTILSGVENNTTLGTPICCTVANTDQRPGDYAEMAAIPRPSHADYTYQKKYGIRARSGGGRSSARETIGRVIGGAVAEKYLARTFGIEIVAWVDSVGDITAPEIDASTVTQAQVDTTAVRCPDTTVAEKMAARIAALRDEKDSTGGVVRCVCRNVPPGLGEPVFDKMEARLAQAMLSIPASKGFEIGSGYAGTAMAGSIHNDPFAAGSRGLVTLSNHSGGVQGGITNGAPLLFSVAFKPPATIGKPQQTVDFDGRSVELAAKGRHDPCVVPRAVPIVEAMAAMVLMDMVLMQSYRGTARD